MSDELAQDESLIKDFLNESNEFLQQLDQDLVALEASPSDEEMLNRAFRAFHTIKGTSGFLGFTQVVTLTHHAEDVLNLLRKKERILDKHTISTLLIVLDHLRMMMRDIRENQQHAYDLDGIIKELTDIQHMAPPPKPKPRLGEMLVAENVLTPAELDDSLKESAATGKKIGEVLVEKQLATPERIQETLLRQTAMAAGQEPAQTVRVDVKKLDELVNLVGELVLERNRLTHLVRDLVEHRASGEALESELAFATARLNFITDELQNAGLRTRMVPVDLVFRRMPRLVRDLSASLNKEVDLKIVGEDTELDKTVVEQIGDPLVHLLRNSLDHGIENPDTRVARGKPRKGTIRLEAQQEGDHIMIVISDDGGGIDPDRIGRIAMERGLVTAERLQGMSKRDILDLIFVPGFSTAEKVSNVSGRGVGMDVVRSNLKKLNGVVELSSEVGKGTVITLRLPLTLAILPVLLVRVDSETYALPLRSVVETLRVGSREVHRTNAGEMLRLRDRVFPLFRLGNILHGTRSEQDKSQLLRIVIMGIADRQLGIIVDQLLGQEETVIKPLPTYLRMVPGLAGATISGDGLVRMILDPAGIASLAGNASMRAD